MSRKIKGQAAFLSDLKQAEQYFRDASNLFMPGVSVNIVVFSYHEGEIRVLITRLADTEYYALPGGYVLNDEDLDDAAIRIFSDWANVSEYHLEQFYTSGKADRTSDHLIREILSEVKSISTSWWFDQRKISVCYFALLNEPSIMASKIDFLVMEYKWVRLSQIPPLLFDHNLAYFRE